MGVRAPSWPINPETRSPRTIIRQNDQNQVCGLSALSLFSLSGRRDARFTHPDPALTATWSCSFPGILQEMASDASHPLPRASEERRRASRERRDENDENVDVTAESLVALVHDEGGGGLASSIASHCIASHHIATQHTTPSHKGTKKKKKRWTRNMGTGNVKRATVSRKCSQR